MSWLCTFAITFVHLCWPNNVGESATFITQPSSVNVSMGGVAEFVCSARENRISDIIWTNISGPALLFPNNASLGITFEISGDETSTQRTSVLRIEGRPEYNGTLVQCIASGVTVTANITSSRSMPEAILLVQGKTLVFVCAFIHHNIKHLIYMITQLLYYANRLIWH